MSMLSTDTLARTLMRPQRVLVNPGQCSPHTCRLLAARISFTLLPVSFLEYRDHGFLLTAECGTRRGRLKA